MTRHLLSIALVLLLAAAPVMAEDTRDPVAIIEQATNHLLETLDARRDEFAANPDALRQLVNDDLLPLIDLRYSARLILGPAGRGASDAQLDAFGGALSNVLLNRYADGLLNFRTGEQMEVLPMKGNNSDKLTRVRTRIRLDNGAHLPIDYAFRRADAGWKVFDVSIEGISYVMTFRNQLAPRAQAAGIDQVTEEIRSGTITLDTD
jgi:phospholipid transport system substrate-binding protein